MKTNGIEWKNILPHIGIILIFLSLTLLYFSPILEGKKLSAHDTVSWEYLAKEVRSFNETTDGEKSMWTNSVFGGMPTYMIASYKSGNILSKIQGFFFNNMADQIFILFLYFISFYFFCLIIGCNKWMALFGSLAMSFASYNIIIIAAGHVTKAIVIAYMAPLIGSIWVAFRKDRIKGSLLTLLFLALAIMNNHVQILYYTLIVLIFFGIVEFIYAIKEKMLKPFFQTLGLLCLMAVLAVGITANLLIPTYEYSKYTMRGDSNGLTPKGQNSAKVGGLDKDYITAWSYGIDETFTLLIPNFKGGASGGSLSTNSETGKELKRMGVSAAEVKRYTQQLPLYWGTQPFTSGPVYLGAIVCFLFVVGLCLVEARTKWWLVPAIILTLMLSWGRNFMPLTDFFIDYVPLYNKFRTVSMTLVATGFCISLMAILGLKEFLKKDADRTKNKKALYIGAGVTGGLCLLFWLIPSLSGNFVGSSDAQLPEFLQKTLPIDRENMLRSDALRSLVFILLSAAILWIYNERKFAGFKVQYLCAMLSLLVLADLYPVAKRYLNETHFEDKKKNKSIVLPSQADKFILEDKSYYRVLDATVNIFNDSKPAYFHKNIGGYHAAKLSRYQELIDYHISSEIQQLFQGLNTARSQADQDSVFAGLGVLNMLNMKYLIYNHEAMPIINEQANGNAWLASTVIIAENADEEMDLLGKINTKTEIVVDKQFESLLANIDTRDTTATIELTGSYAPNKLRYKFDSQTDQIAVFSEIYYEKGWDAFIDGEKVPYFRANYLLRAMPLKAGSYEIEFRFKPKSYEIGNLISAICSGILLLLLVGYVVFRIRDLKKQK